MPSAANLVGSTLFGLLGMGAFGYGKREGALQAMLIGLALMAFPYCVTSTWALYAVGAALTVALWRWHE